MKDKELDDLREEVELLKEAQGVSANSNGTPDAAGFADRDDERPEWFDRVSASAGSEPVTGSPDDGGESGGDP